MSKILSYGLFVILAANFIIAIYLGQSHFNFQNLLDSSTASPRILQEEPAVPPTTTTTPSPFLGFQDPELAYLILEQLDIFEVFSDPNYSKQEAKAEYSRPYYGLAHDDNYCHKHREYFVHNADQIFKKKKFVTNYKSKTPLRYEVIPNIGGEDVMPYIHSGMDEDIAEEKIFDFRTDLNMFFTSTNLCEYRIIGKHFSCLTQSSNHIPGHDHLHRKDYVAKSLRKYAKSYESRPQCFNDTKFFPRTWTMLDKEQCQEFFKVFNGEKYTELKKERGLVYIRKIGANAHQGTGVFPVNEKDEVYIRKLYANGTLCGHVEENNLMQYAIWNPLLLEGRKFDFRMFMIIASTNPLIVYYRDGFLRVSLRDYTPDSEDKGAILTNIALSKPLFDLARENGTYNGYSEDMVLNQAFWTMPKLERYLLEAGKINDEKWLENYLRPEFKKAMIHLLRMGSPSFAKRSSLYEIYGLDFMLDDKLNLWFIEANSAPLLNGWSEDTKLFFNSILYDSFEIAFNLLRSRVKRIINYVNKVVQEDGILRIGEKEIYIPELAAKRMEFIKVTKNYFEPEFEVSRTNKYVKIIDENLSGVDRYFGLLESECD